MEIDEIDALRASVELLRGTTDGMIDEVRRRTGQPPDRAPQGPRHIDEVLAADGELSGRGFVIPGDRPPAS